jgi:hypothetical protein
VLVGVGNGSSLEDEESPPPFGFKVTRAKWEQKRHIHSSTQSLACEVIFAIYYSDGYN